jgi:hypothetical protein
MCVFDRAINFESTSNVLATQKQTHKMSQYSGAIKGVSNYFAALHAAVPIPAVDLRNDVISWDTLPIPSFFVGMTLSDFLADPSFKVTFDTQVTYSGQTSASYGGTLYLTFQSAGGQTFALNSGLQHGGIAQTRPINRATDAKGAIVSGTTSFTPESHVFGTDNLSNVYITVSITNLIVSMNCEGPNFEQPGCKQFCGDPATAGACFADMEGYCFPAGASHDEMPFGTSKTCKDYVVDYITTVGPTSKLDDDLFRYCRVYADQEGDAVVGNMSRLFGTPGVSAEEQDICACHLSPHAPPDATDVYDDYLAQLKDQFCPDPDQPCPFIEATTNPPCYVPQCANSPYKSVDTSSRCVAPACLNIVNFEANGDVDVNVEQNSNCYSTTATKCTNDDQCAPKACDKATGKCVTGPVECASAADCEANETCVQGHCVVPAVSCASDADCLSEFECSGGTCVEKKGLPPWVWVLVGVGVLILIVIIVLVLVKSAKK